VTHTFLLQFFSDTVLKSALKTRLDNFMGGIVWHWLLDAMICRHSLAEEVLKPCCGKGR